MSKEDARRVRHEIFIRSVLLMGSRTGKLAEVVIVSRGAAAPMGRIMSFVDIPTRREVFEEVETLVGHTNIVECMAKLDDGRVVSGSYDKTLIVWAAGDDGAFAAAQTLSGHTGDVNCVAPLDGGRLVSGSYDNTLIVWAAGDDGSFAAAQTLSGHTGGVWCVAPLDDGRLASGSSDNTLKVWE